MKTIKRLVIVALLMLAAPNAFAQNPVHQGANTPSITQFAQKDVKTVELLLSGYHGLGPRDAFNQVPKAEQIVNAIAHGPDGYLRDRALGALGKYWPSADVFMLYARVVASPQTRFGTRNRVMMDLAADFGDQAIPTLKPFLKNDNVQLRITAVEALASIGSDQSFQVLSKAAKSETNPVVLQRIQDKAHTLH